MATFTPEQQPLGTPNFTWRSRGIDSSPNTGIGKLFEGLAQGLDTGVKVADQAEQRKITDDIQSQAEKIQNDFDTKSEAFLGFGGQSGADLPLPSGFKQGMAGIQNLQSAQLQGKLPDLYYWNRLNIMTKQLKTQYPGYADRIDDMVSSVVGAKPANRLQAELSDAWASAYQKSGATDPLTKLAEKMSSDGTLNFAAPDYFQRLQSNDPYTYQELMQKQASWNSQTASIALRNSQLSLQKDQNALDTRSVTQQYQQAASAGVAALLQNTSGTVGKDYSQAANLINKLNDERKQGILPTQDEQNQMLALGNELQVGAQSTLNRLYTSQWDNNDPDPQKNFAYWVSPSDRKAADESAMQPVLMIAQALKDKDFGLLGAVQSWLSANTNETSAAIIKKYPVLSYISGAKALVGDQTASVMFGNSKSQGAVADAIGGVIAGKMITNPPPTTTDPPAPPSKVLSDGDQAGVGPQAAQAMIDKWNKLSDLINDPKMNSDAIKNGVNWVTSEPPSQFFSQFTPQSSQIMFQQMASPQVTQNMLKYKEQGGTETWNKYVDWVRNAFLLQAQDVLTRMQTANTALNLTSDDNAYNIKFDPVTNQFSDTGYMKNLPFNSTQPDLDNLNKDIATIVPILKAAKLDPAKELKALFENDGFTGGRSGLIDGLLNAIGNFVAPKAY